MAKISFAFSEFPLFDGRRPIYVKGDVTCESLSIKQSDPPELGDIKWHITDVKIDASLRGKLKVNLAQDEWLRQDLSRWLRGRHGAEIERQLRGEIPHQGEKDKR